MASSVNARKKIDQLPGMIISRLANKPYIYSLIPMEYRLSFQLTVFAHTKIII